MASSLQYRRTLSRPTVFYVKEQLRSIIPLLRAVPVPAWLQDDESAVEEPSVLQLVKAVEEKRKSALGRTETGRRRFAHQIVQFTPALSPTTRVRTV